MQKKITIEVDEYIGASLESIICFASCRYIENYDDMPEYVGQALNELRELAKKIDIALLKV